MTDAEAQQRIADLEDQVRDLNLVVLATVQYATTVAAAFGHAASGSADTAKQTLKRAQQIEDLIKSRIRVADNDVFDALKTDAVK